MQAVHDNTYLAPKVVWVVRASSDTERCKYENAASLLSQPWVCSPPAYRRNRSHPPNLRHRATIAASPAIHGHRITTNSIINSVTNGVTNGTSRQNALGSPFLGLQPVLSIVCKPHLGCYPHPLTGERAAYGLFLTTTNRIGGSEPCRSRLPMTGTRQPGIPQPRLEIRVAEP